MYVPHVDHYVSEIKVVNLLTVQLQSDLGVFWYLRCGDYYLHRGRTAWLGWMDPTRFFHR